MAKTKTAPSKAKQGVVLPAEQEHPDVRMVTTEGGAIAAFIANAAVFFQRAGELEEQAKSALIIARTLIEPVNQSTDEDVQAFIRKANVGSKTVEAHWDICGVFFKVHRMLTARRGLATQAYTDAAAIAQRLHNTYADKERRRAADEQERLRVEAENRAREQRERELAAAEQQALDLEAASADLSEREQRFVKLVADNNQPPRLAAFNAGYKNADLQGQSLMERPKIQAAIAALRQASHIRQQTEAIREAPLDVNVEIVKPRISKGGGYDRTTHSGEVLDASAFIAAVIAGKHGIPWDVLTVNQSKLNDYAGSLQERLNAWPGVRYKKNTRTV